MIRVSAASPDSRASTAGPNRIRLASASPRRAQLLQSAGIDVDIAPIDCDESWRREETALDYVHRVAERKLQAAFEQLGAGPLTLCADTVVWLESDAAPLGKPTTRAMCADYLAKLGTKAGHCVTTAWTLGCGPHDLELHSCTTRVWMRALAPPELRAYLEGDGWRDKAGGYGIQAEAASWVSRIEGSYTNVVGLPLAQVVARLQERNR